MSRGSCGNLATCRTVERSTSGVFAMYDEHGKRAKQQCKRKKITGRKALAEKIVAPSTPTTGMASVPSEATATGRVSAARVQAQ